MSKIYYLKGDATQPIGYGNKIVAHVCNNVGAWGAGFVLAVSKRWPIAKRTYIETANRNELKLGMTQFVCVDSEIFVANMVAQNNINDGRRGWFGDLIDYDALRQCLDEVFRFAAGSKASVHMPRIGCGLAGSKWENIEPLLIDVVKQYNVDCYVYDFGRQ